MKATVKKNEDEEDDEAEDQDAEGAEGEGEDDENESGYGEDIGDGYGKDTVDPMDAQERAEAEGESAARIKRKNQKP